MKSFIDLWKDVVQRVVQSPREQPSAVTIPNNHVDQQQLLDGPFKRDTHYFQVRVNEMYLAHQRKWFSAIDPMLFVVSEFTYDKKEQSVPFLIGPAMMKNKLNELPQGMLFRDTRVAGIHPYRGGRLTLSVVLCQVKVGDYARQLLGLLEGAANTLDFSTALGSYVEIAGVILDGFEAMLGLGDTTPLVGLRCEFDPDAGDPFAPGFFALIDKPDVSARSLWVRDRQLMKGDSLAESIPYRDADFVLYSVVRPPENSRTDLDKLAFYPLWERVQREATTPTEENYASARSNMVSLYQTIVLSPDLITSQAEALADDYGKRMKELYDRAKGFGQRARESVSATDLDRIRDRSLSFLNQKAQ